MGTDMFCQLHQMKDIKITIDAGVEAKFEISKKVQNLSFSKISQTTDKCSWNRCFNQD